MSWGVKVSGTIDLTALRGDIGKKAMRQIGEAAKTAILVETQDKGIDQDGRRFRPYSRLYSEARSEAGYNTRPDLTVTGDMLNAVVIVSATENSVTIGFNDSQKAGHRSKLDKGKKPKYKLLPSEKMQRTQKLRPWFGFGRDNNDRRKQIQKRGSRIYIEALTKRVAGRNKGRV